MAPAMPPPNSQENASDTVLSVLSIAMLVAIALLGRYFIVYAAWKHFYSPIIVLSNTRDNVLPVLFGSPTTEAEVRRLNTAKELINRYEPQFIPFSCSFAGRGDAI